MKSFIHHNAKSLTEAIRLLTKYRGKAKPIAGGTDLLGVLKEQSLPRYPEAIINLKTITGLAYIRDNEEGLRIGALTTLGELAASSVMKEQYKILYDAARSVATPQIRNMCTIGGNLAQDVRCWYYRYPQHLGGSIQCLRKGGKRCNALSGDNRYHSIFGGAAGCVAVNPSDVGIALVALDAEIETTKRRISTQSFFETKAKSLAKLDPDELITEIQIPRPSEESRQAYLKFTLRKPVDFAIASVATVIIEKDRICKDARIVLGAVAPKPIRAFTAEDAIKDSFIDNERAIKAAQQAVRAAKPLSKNRYKIEIVKILVKRSLLGEKL